MKILIINSGSSSLKFQMIEMQDNSVLCSGLVERIGEKIGKVTYKKFPDTAKEEKTNLEQPIENHATAMRTVVKMLTDTTKGVIKDTAEINAIGHRVLHGGEAFTQPSRVDDTVIQAIKDCIPLGPLHNPANLSGIEVAQELFPGIPQAVVFDTEFHQTMPPKAFLYALPYELYEKYSVRRYGFHGTSHKYVAAETAKLLGKNKEDCNIITVHLGNGSSLAAVKAGKCIDTSMGMTPLAGVVMGTRSGDIDPAIQLYLHRTKGLSFEEIDTLLNKQSGFKGICGVNDMRDIHAKAEKGDKQAKLAFDVFVYSVTKYIGAYSTVLERVDAITFTAGIGENDDIAREHICAGLKIFGIKIDTEKNKNRFKEPTAIHSTDSKVQVWVVPTNEELQIARETMNVLGLKA